MSETSIGRCSVGGPLLGGSWGGQQHTSYNPMKGPLTLLATAHGLSSGTGLREKKHAEKVLDRCWFSELYAF